MAKSCRCQKVSKSLVVKRNKARNSILLEIAKNRQKTNAGGAIEARRRRQMVGEKLEMVRNTPWPLNSSLPNSSCYEQRKEKLPSFGLLATKMKQKIESCYGKEEASKLKLVTIGFNDSNEDTTFQ